MKKLLLIPFMLLLIFLVCKGQTGYFYFYTHMFVFDGIVTKVKEMKLPPDRGNGHCNLCYSSSFYIDGYQVYVQVSSKGKYVIEIVTRDWNHAGLYGYFYPDEIPVQDGDEFPRDVPRVFSELDSRLSQHWWMASNNLL